ncbi:MAG: alpha/beta fold hydrolase [Gammaproteobacteria bacterium]|nr:alpha/beta fold hydrolase [Gammaproteobacteria bacterium]
MARPESASKYLLIKEFLVDGPAEASHVLVLAHGAGLGMASPFMEFVARGIAENGIRVVRFHFPYMEESVRSGRRKPPDGGRILRASYSEVIDHCLEQERCPRHRLVIGGKSMGGRVASMIADRHGVAGVVCLGYPFHPPRQPERLRTEHLADLRTPMLICQGERDRFGNREEVTGYRLSSAVRLHWLSDGNHELAPRKASGRSHEDNLREAVETACDFIRAL